LDEITPVNAPESPTPAPPPSLPFRRPADYYSSPVGDARPLFPRWVPYGCGSAAIVVLLIVFGLGIAAQRGLMGEMFELMLASMQGEIDKMFTPDVKPADKATFDAMHAADRMAHDKLKEGIEGFSKSLEDLEKMLAKRVSEIAQPA